MSETAGLLILTRRLGERVRIETPGGHVIWIAVSSFRGSKKGTTAVSLAFDADRNIVIDREEVHHEKRV